jgi:hypothetical protein
VIDNPNDHDITGAWLNETLGNYLQEGNVIKPEFFADILIVGTAELEPRYFRTRWGTSLARSIRYQDTLHDVFGRVVVAGLQAV